MTVSNKELFMVLIALAIAVVLFVVLYRPVQPVFRPAGAEGFRTGSYLPVDDPKPLTFPSRNPTENMNCAEYNQAVQGWMGYTKMSEPTGIPLTIQVAGQPSRLVESN